MSLEEIVRAEVGTARMGAPITVTDIMIWARYDGHDMSRYTAGQVAKVLTKVCDSRPGPYDAHCRRSYYRRSEA